MIVSVFDTLREEVFAFVLLNDNEWNNVGECVPDLDREAVISADVVGVTDALDCNVPVEEFVARIIDGVALRV